jgi:hypothetical protein
MEFVMASWVPGSWRGHFPTGVAATALARTKMRVEVNFIMNSEKI